jgi:hypothetical protein
MKKLAALSLSLFLTVGMALADSPKDTPKDAPPSKSTTAAKPATPKTNAEIAAEMEELRQALQAQQEQLQMLKEELAKRDRDIEAAREAAAAANSRASEAHAKASEAEATSNEVKSEASALNTSVASLAASNAAAGNAPAGNSAPVNASAAASSGQGAGAEEKGPLTIRYKGVNITPGGFFEFATVLRTRATSADIPTPFTGIPYNGSALGKVTEWNQTARQSRITSKVDTNIGSTKVTGYYEADFLGAGTTSNNRQTNSYVFRQRQIWGRAQLDNGWSFIGGQMWSLATEYKKGLTNLLEATPMMIDPNYVVGFTWQRAPAFRVTKAFGDKFTVGASIEEPQLTVAGHNFTTYTSTNALGAVTTFQNFWVDALGSGAGLYNAFDPTGYSVNKLPDFIVKAALDEGPGHFEVFGIVSEFRSRVYPCAVVGTTAGNFPHPAVPVVLSCGTTTTPSATSAYNNSDTAGGFGVSGTVSLLSKKLDVGAKGVYGDGIGRFGAAQIADATARPNGTLVGIHNAQFLAKVELHPSPKIDIYAYYGGEYGGRANYNGYQTVTITATPAIPGCGGVGQQPCPGGGIQPAYPALTATAITLTRNGGYGYKTANNSGCGVETPPTGTSAPGGGGTCTGDVRYVNETTIGFWHKLYQGEKGRVQWGATYSYLYKVGWSGSGGTAAGSPAISPKANDNMFWTSFRYYLP